MSTVDVGVRTQGMDGTPHTEYGVKSFRLERNGLGGYDMRQ